MSAPIPDLPDSSRSPSSNAFNVVDVSLHDVARDLTMRFVEGDLEASLVRIRPIETGLEVGTKCLDGDHPALWLTGGRFEDEVDAVGAVTGGRVFSLDDPSTTLGRAVVTVIVSRRGEVASASFDHNGEFRSGIDGGLVVDLLKRSIVVPTDPPPCGPDVLFAGVWLSAIQGFIDAEDRVPSWSEIVSLHPAVEMLDRDVDDGGLIGAVHDDLEIVGRAFAGVLTWQKLRDALDNGTLKAPGLNAGEGAWFDDGSFARRLLVERPPLRQLRRDVASRLPARLWQRVEDTLDALGIPTSCWPDEADELRPSA